MGKEEKYEETPVSCPGMSQTINSAENNGPGLGRSRAWKLYGLQAGPIKRI